MYLHVHDECEGLGNSDDTSAYDFSLPLAMLSAR
jgi:hypothetical protein